METVRSVDDLQKVAALFAERQSKIKYRFLVCAGTGCIVNGSLDVFREFQRVLETGMTAEAAAACSGCQGLCQQGPLMCVLPAGIFYTGVKPADVQEIVDSAVRGEPVERLLYKKADGSSCLTHDEVPFYFLQDRQVLARAGKLDPEEIREYIAAGGYLSLAKALTMTPEAVIDEVSRSKLRGRGGAGFPTGKKWAEALRQPGAEKYLVCNADEGDPGAFMDGYLLESDPHAVLEGMIIGGYAIGANNGMVYVRAEYPLALQRVRRAILQAREMGLLGSNILNSGFNFEVDVFLGGGVFICGESTALVASLEGRVGEPRQKPPHLVEHGYLGRPTVINNVETLANVPLIIRLGATEYTKCGTEKSGGTKIFCLAGKVNNTGLVEVPIGSSLREVIYQIGGGIKDDKQFKAVQTGGPSGGCLPSSCLEMPTDFDELSAAGSMMGSGGMIVMDDETCMVDIARYFLTFLKDESCGKCFSCREGISRMLEVILDITAGRGTGESLELLVDVAETVKDASLCGLGQSAPNPVLSTIRYFPEEYRAHILEKKCPAGVCKALVSYSVLAEACTGCSVCVRKCPTGAVSGLKGEVHAIEAKLCSKCGVCLDSCKFSAIQRS